MWQPQKKGKKDLVYLLGLSDSTSLVDQNIQLKQTQATNSNTKIIENEYDHKDQEPPEPLGDIWADKFFKKNLNYQEKFQKRLRSANPTKRDKNNILPRQEFMNYTDEEKLQEMFLKTQDQFDLDSAVKLLSGVAAENYLMSNQKIQEENSRNKQIKTLNVSTKNTNERVITDWDKNYFQADEVIQKENDILKFLPDQGKKNGLFFNQKQIINQAWGFQNLETQKKISIFNNRKTQQSKSNQGLQINDNHIFQQAYNVFGKKALKNDKEEDLTQMKVEDRINFLVKKKLDKKAQKIRLKSANQNQKIFIKSNNNEFQLKKCKKFRKKYLEGREQNLLNKFKLFDQINKLTSKSQQQIELDLCESSLNLSSENKQTDAISTSIHKKKETSNPEILQKKVRNSMIAYIKKERAFTNLYQQKLQELRAIPQNLLDIPKITEEEDECNTTRYTQRGLEKDEDLQEGTDQTFKMADLNLYKTNHKFNQLISSKIRILNRIKKISNGDNVVHNLTVYRRFKHKDGKVQIDPIRQMALRVMPINRVIQGLTGAGPEQSFVKAVQHAIRNDFTQAIDQLHKGLSINPNSMHCRFTHGVLMFKLGLLSQAKQDFKNVSEQFPKELSSHFNYALVLLELGDYHPAIQILKKVTDKSIVTNDLDLLQDANILQAQCYWRTKQPLEAVKSFQIAQRLKAKMQRRTNEKIGKVEDLESQLRNWEIRQMKNDIEQDQLKGLQGISKSPKVESTYDVVQRHRKAIQDRKTINTSEEKIQTSEFIIDNPTTLRKFETTELVSIKGILRNSVSVQSQESFNQNQEKNRFYININQGEVPKLSTQNQIKQISTLNQQSIDVVQSFEENIRSYTCRGSHRDQFMYNLRTQKEVFDSQMNQATPLKLQKQQTSVGQTPLNLTIQKQLSKISNSPQKLSLKNSDYEVKDFSQQTKKQVNIMKQAIKSYIQNIIKEKQKINDQLFEKKVTNFYKILRDQSLKVIDKNTKMRFDKVFSHLIKSDDISDKLSSKDLHSLFGEEDNDLTEEEIKIIQLYQTQLKNFVKDEGHVQKNVVKYDDKVNAFTQFMMNKDKEKATIKVRNLAGIDFNPNGVVEINQDQGNLDDIMQELLERLRHVDHVINSEMDKDDHRIFNFSLKNIDLNEFRQNLFDGNKASLDSNTLQQAKIIRKGDKFIQKLRQSLTKEIQLPYDLCSILKTDLEMKEKQRILEKEQKYQKEKRIDNRKMEMIRREFNLCHGAERSLQILDLTLNHLKFFKNLEVEKRMMIYKKAEILSLPSRTVLFNQGDKGDKMYVILKGRVAVEQHSDLTGGVSIVIAMLTDGVHFGELSLLDNSQVESNTKKSLLVGEQDKKKFSGRAATCVTAEQCDLLVLDHQLCVNIYQPTIPTETQIKKSENEKEDESTFRGDSVSGAAAQDFLSRKIRALQGIPYFSDIDPTLLKNIAANISTKTYLYGECILRKGDIPHGLIVILKGQCRIVAQRIARRKLPEQIDGDAFTGLGALKRDYNKMGIVDNTVFNFNPTTTVLNQSYNSDAAFQNQVIYIDKEGQEIKGEIEYIDFMRFKQITKGDYFGGRVLVPYEHYSSIKRILFGDQSLEINYPLGASRQNFDEKGEEYHQMKSLLSVIADSSKVEVWVIDKKLMAYLKEKELKVIYEKIVKDVDADRLYHEKDIEYITEHFKQFDRYKTGLVESFIRQSAMQRYFNHN